MIALAFAMSPTQALQAASTRPLPIPMIAYTHTTTGNGGLADKIAKGIKWHNGAIMAIPRWPKVMWIFVTEAVASV